MRQRRFDWLPGLAVFLVTALVYSSVLRNRFVDWDVDVERFLDSPMRNLGWSQLRWMFTTFYASTYNPFASILTACLYHVRGADPVVFHLASLLLHSANAGLFCLIAARLLRLAAVDSRPVETTTASMFAALAFSLHPIGVIAVASTSAMGDLLGAFFFLLSLLYYVEASLRPPPGRRLWIVLSWISFFASMMSRWVGICLPLVLVVLDVHPMRRLGGGTNRRAEKQARDVWIEKIPYLLISSLAAAAYALAKHLTDIRHANEWKPLVTALGLVFYFKKILVPTQLMPVYVLYGPYNAVGGSPELCAAAVVLTTSALVAAGKRWPSALAAWVCYAAAVLPPLLVIHDGWMLVSDRYAYLPCMAVSLPAAGGMILAWRRWAGRAAGRLLLLILGGSILTCLALRTRCEIPAWHDSVALWSRVLEIDPESMVANDRIAVPLMQQGRVDEAISRFRKALGINPRSSATRYNYGVALLHLGKFQEAADQFREVLRLDPNEPDARAGLELALRKIKGP